MAGEAVETIADRYASRAVSSVFLYTREAHPGEHYRQHTSMDDKRRNARAFLEHGRIRRRILLDDRNGPQAVADFERMLQKAGAARSAPSEDIGPRIPGNFYKTEDESGRK